MRSYLPLALILLIFSVLTLYQSIVLPIGEAADETDHYQYLRFVARSGHPPLTEAGRDEAGFKGGLAPLYYWLAAWPIALVGEDTLPDIRRTDARPERHIPEDGLGINHVVHTLDEGWPWRGQVLAWHLVRFLSLPLALITITVTYLLVRRLVPEPGWVALAAAAFVALLPRFVISSAVINDDNLIFALIALLLLIQVAMLQSRRPPEKALMAAFGALFGLTLVTKYFALILIPEILFTLLVISLTVPTAETAESNRPARYRSILALLAPFFAALFITAGLWFIFIVIRFNRISELGLIPGLAASLGEPQITGGLISLLSGQSMRPAAAAYDLPEWLGLLYRSFWFEYGWMRIFAPGWIYLLFTIFSLGAAAGLIGIIRTYVSDRNGTSRTASRFSLPIILLLGLHLALFVIVVLARYVLSATIDTGQGRHLYPALPVIALLAALGVSYLTKQLSRPFLLRTRRIALPAAIAVLLITAWYLAPALIVLRPANFILPHYDILPVTATMSQPAAKRPPIAEFGSGQALVGIETEHAVAAGDTLPVTLYWQANRETEQDYLISLCLTDDRQRPVGCWRGHFGDGRYPARAWEGGDTLIDTIHIPIPACFRITDRLYTLELTLWPLDSAQVAPSPEDKPVIHHRFPEPQITIRATDSLRSVAQTAELWRGPDRLSGPATMELRQSLAWITYSGHDAAPSPAFDWPDGPQQWLPLAGLNTPLYLPCSDGPEPFAHLAHFVVDPTLAGGLYRPDPDQALPEINLALRQRTFAPLTSTLTFSDTLAPLELKLMDRSVNLRQSTLNPDAWPEPYLLNPAATAQLPVTIHWQAHRWMGQPLIAALKLLDKDFSVGGERIATLGSRYPNLLWVPTETVEETYVLTLKPDIPPGLYQLELGLLRQTRDLAAGYENLPLNHGNTILGENLYPALIRVVDPARDAEPSITVEAQLGASIRLIGYDVNPTFFDSPAEVALTLYWQSTAGIPVDYTVFTQLLGPDGQVWAQWDNPPQGGRYPTTAWSETDLVVDRYRLTLRENPPAGEYRLLVGMYDSTTGERLDVTVNGQPRADNAVELETLPFNP